MRWKSSAPCSLLAPAERLECLDKLSHDIAPLSPARPAASPAPGGAPAADNWIVSETTSPLDYTPVAIATALSSGGPDGAILQLSIQCRGGRTDLMITGPALTGRGEDPVVSYVVNDGQPVVVAAGPSASGAGVTIRGDVVRLLASLPDRGEISFRVTPRQGAALAVRPGRLENRAGPAGRPLQMAGRRRRTAQLTTPEQQPRQEYMVTRFGQ